MFDASLIESAVQRRSPKRYLSVPASVLIHALVIGSGLAISMWFVDEVPEPPIPVTFDPTVVPPPPPPPRAAAALKVQRTVELVKPTQVVAPVAVPDALPPPAAEASPETSFSDGGVDDGVDGGIPDGVIGSVLGPPANVVGSSSNVVTPMRIGGEVREPVEVTRVQPIYPEAARRAHIQGIVILEAVITKEGNVESVRVLLGLNPLLDTAAMRAVSQWKYRAATFNGRPVPVYLTVKLTFRLQ
jgi:protein TonB